MIVQRLDYLMPLPSIYCLDGWIRLQVAMVFGEKLNYYPDAVLKDQVWAGQSILLSIHAIDAHHTLLSKPHSNHTFIIFFFIILFNTCINFKKKGWGCISCILVVRNNISKELFQVSLHLFFSSSSFDQLCICNSFKQVSYNKSSHLIIN